MGKVIKGDFGGIAHVVENFVRENQERVAKKREAKKREEKAYLAARHYVGAKYEATKNLDIAEIAKLVRKDIKAAVKSGDLPKAKYSVKISRYSMGRSITVAVTGLEMETANMERHLAEARDRSLRHRGVPVGKLMTEEAYELEAKVEALVNAYNFDRSNPMEDYYNSAFAGFVNLECNHEAARKRAEDLVAAEVNEDSQDDWLTYLGVTS